MSDAGLKGFALQQLSNKNPLGEIAWDFEVVCHVTVNPLDAVSHFVVVLHRKRAQGTVGFSRQGNAPPHLLALK
jgi:hypothetical protein